MNKRGLSDQFFWGGATAANQFEGGYISGGRGISTADILTAGNRFEERKITLKTEKGEEKEFARCLDKGGAVRYYVL